MFTETQKAELAKNLDKKNVASREQSGRKLSYVEGWHVIAEANRIFGFDGWTRETVEIRCVSENPRKLGKAPNQRDGFGVSYVCRVRVTVDALVREGTGAGHGIDADLGLAHESAIKEAETDAMKRALMTFGNPFGLALYDKTHTNVGVAATGTGEEAATPFDAEPTESEKRILARMTDEIGKLVNLKAMDTWRTLPENVAGFKDLPISLRADLQNAMSKRRAVLSNVRMAG